MLDFLHLFSLSPDQIFLDILNRSLAAVVIMAAMLLARWLLKKLPRRLTVVLWLVVFFRLLVPFTLESPVALMPQKEIIPPHRRGRRNCPLLPRTLYCQTDHPGRHQRYPRSPVYHQDSAGNVLFVPL